MRLRKLTVIGGLLAAMGGAGHLVVSTAMRRDVWSNHLAAGLPGKVSLSPTAAEITVAETFWYSVGSFAVPLMAIGALVLWLYRNGQRVPGFVGWFLLTWALAIGVTGGFDGGTVLLILVGALVGAGDLNLSGHEAASATAHLGRS